jgi:hypothetical protein
VEKKYSEFVSVSLDPSLPSNKLYDNLRRLGVDLASSTSSKSLTLTLMRSGLVIFLTRPSLSTGIDFNQPELSLVLVTEDDVCNAVMSVKSNTAGVDEILRVSLNHFCLFCWVR